MVEVANAAMLRALRLVSVQRGYDLRDFTLIAYGGAGPIHAGALARQAGIARVLVPVHSGAFSALGLPGFSAALRRGADVSVSSWKPGRPSRPRNGSARLEERCVAPLLAEGIGADRIVIERSVDLRYSGQNYELEVSWRPTPEALRAGFENRHRQLYGYATGETVECVNLRVVARVPDVAIDVPAFEPAADSGVIGEQPAHFAGVGEVTLPRYDRAALAPGRRVVGPALVEDAWSTTLVYPGQRWRGRSPRQPRPGNRAMIHPVTLEVVRNALYAIAEEISVVLMRSARSPLLKEAGDLSSAADRR